MILIQFPPGASVDARIESLAEFMGGLADAVGQQAFADALGARRAEREAAAAAAKAEAEKAAAAVPARVKRGKGKKP